MFGIRGRKALPPLSLRVKWETGVNLEMLGVHYCKVTKCAVKINFSLPGTRIPLLLD